ERALYRAVLAVAAVQRDEHPREALALELVERPLGRIERMGVDAAPAQRSQHAGTRHHRHLALGRAAAEQHGDLAQCRGIQLRFELRRLGRSGWRGAGRRAGRAPRARRVLAPASRGFPAMLAAPAGAAKLAALACASSARTIAARMMDGAR